LIDQLSLRKGLRVLDVGCGVGFGARRLAELVAPEGNVVAVDMRAEMIAEGRRRQAGGGVRVELLEADLERLDFEDATFDRCRADRALASTEAPDRVVAEMVRVLRPGGTVGIFDFDWDTLFIDGCNRETSRRIARSFSDSFRHGTIGRTLPRLLSEASLVDIECFPHAVHMHFELFSRRIRAAVESAVRLGALDFGEVTRWWRELEAAAAAGTFHAGALGFAVAGRKE
jgi:SAM-dependent methyltransferase